MINLIGYLKKILSSYRKGLSLTVAVTISVLFLNSAAIAQEGLSTTSQMSLNITSDRALSGSVSSTLTNSGNRTVVAKFYTFTLPISDVELTTILHSLEGSTSTQKLEFTTRDTDSGTKVTVDMREIRIQPNSSHRLSIQFNKQEFIELDNDIVEIPARLVDSPTSYTNIKISKSFGDIAFIKQSGVSLSELGDNYVITLRSPKVPILELVYADELSFAFNVQKELANDTDTAQLASLTLPAFTYYQSVVIDRMQPEPAYQHIDDLGNVTLTYNIAPMQTLDVSIGGYIYQNRGTSSFQIGSEKLSISNTGFWELRNDTLNSFEDFLRSNNFDPVSNRNYNTMSAKNQERFLELSYLYTTEQLSIQENEPSFLTSSGQKQSALQRLGAAEALEQRTGLSRIDITDSYLAILRSYGVRAVMVEGLVTNTSEVYNSDFFHHWVQLYSPADGWLSMDPAFETETGIRMYDFTSVDHIPLVIRSSSSTFPVSSFASTEEIRFTRVSSVPDGDVLGAKATALNVKSDDLSDVLQELRVENMGGSMILQVDLKLPTRTITLTDNKLLPGSEFLIPIDDYDLTQSDLEDLQVSVRDVFGNASDIEISVESSTYHYWWWDPLLVALSVLFISTALYLASTLYLNIRSKA